MNRECFTFRLTDNCDPEERYEEAALFKAVCDVAPLPIRTVRDGDPILCDFGRLLKDQVGPPLPYWNDAAFMREVGRPFFTVRAEDAKKHVQELQIRGKGAFIKSTREKHFICRIGATERFEKMMGDMIYSFIDGGPKLMIQELVDLKFETRFFVIDRKIVTGTPNASHLTPRDHPWNWQWHFETPASKKAAYIDPAIKLNQYACAERIARGMQWDHAVIDTGMIGAKAVAVEINPLQLGSVGLFACSVDGLVAAAFRSPTFFTKG